MRNPIAFQRVDGPSREGANLRQRERVGHVWLVDPLLQTLEVLRLDGPGYRLAGVWRGDVVVQCEPFEALAIRLADLWSA